MVLIPRVYTRVKVFFYTNHPLLKVLLTTQVFNHYNAMENKKKKKRNSVKM